MSIHPEPSEALVDLKTYRHKQQQNQSTFWLPLAVTQSGGSRYEGGRLPARPTQLLMALYLTGRVTDEDLAEAAKAIG